MTNEDLNIKVAEAQGIPVDICMCGDSKESHRMGGNEHTFTPMVDALPAYTSDLNAAFSLLDGLSFDVFTCNAGYGCRIYASLDMAWPGLANDYADTLPLAICRAFVKLKGVKA